MLKVEVKKNIIEYKSDDTLAHNVIAIQLWFDDLTHQESQWIRGDMTNCNIFMPFRTGRQKSHVAPLFSTCSNNSNRVDGSDALGIKNAHVPRQIFFQPAPDKQHLLKVFWELMQNCFFLIVIAFDNFSSFWAVNEHHDDHDPIEILLRIPKSSSGWRWLDLGIIIVVVVLEPSWSSRGIT